MVLFVEECSTWEVGFLPEMAKLSSFRSGWGLWKLCLSSSSSVEYGKDAHFFWNLSKMMSNKMLYVIFLIVQLNSTRGPKIWPPVCRWYHPDEWLCTSNSTRVVKLGVWGFPSNTLCFAPSKCEVAVQDWSVRISQLLQVPRKPEHTWRGCRGKGINPNCESQSCFP